MKGRRIKKKIWWIAILLCSIFFAACGAKENGGIPSGAEGASAGTEDAGANTASSGQDVTVSEDLKAMMERTEYYDFSIQKEKIFDLGLWEKNDHEKYASSVLSAGGTVYRPMGTQFYQGEPVQLWAEVTREGAKLYVYGEDGTCQLLLEGLREGYVSSSRECKWYLDGEGNYYCSWMENVSVDGSYVSQGHFMKVLSSGEFLEQTELEPGIRVHNFCQAGDGRMYMMLWDRSEGRFYLEEVDTVTGKGIPESRVEISVQLGQMLGPTEDGLAVVGYFGEYYERKIVEVNPADGSTTLLQSFSGTSYEFQADMALSDFQVLADGTIEMLWTKNHVVGNGSGGLLERLKMEKVEKIPIVLRGVYVQGMADIVNRFNMENDTYQVLLEDCIDEGEWENFFRLTSVQIGAGKGPDIICGTNMPQSLILGMLEKGALEDLAPYIEASGIREEDYFPMAFSTWRQEEKIYGVKYKMSIYGERINQEILGSGETPDIETLADALLAMEKDGVYFEGWDSGEVLDSFYQGTDSLFGMVDWEKGTCDFDTPLFGKLLEAARRHGDDGRKNPEFTIMEEREFWGPVRYWDQEEQGEGKSVVSGVLFDDGCYAAISPENTLAVNANSPKKEGAWEFIRFLLSEECQSGEFDWTSSPVNREAYKAFMQWNIIDLTEIKYVNGVNIWGQFPDVEVTEERQAEFLKIIEEAKPLPIRTEAIRAIILDEAKDYFNGYKSAEEISRVVNNRVQLYLDENR